MTQTPWLSDIDIKEKYPPLSVGDHHTTDVVVVGGGITGVLSAYLLHTAGKKVILLDKGKIQDATTSYTTAFITSIIDTSISEMIKIYGKAEAHKILKSGEDAIDCIENIVKKENIDCDFVRTSEYVFARDTEEYEELVKEAKNAKELGFDFILHSEKKIPFKNYGSLEVPRQAKFHPLKFLIALRQKLIEQGVLIFEKTEVVEIQYQNPVRVVTRSGAAVEATDVIIATYQPFNNPLQLFAHKGMYISYVMEVFVPKDAIADGLYLDMNNPYHYMRVEKEGNRTRIILGGEDHRKEFWVSPQKSYGALRKYLENILPGVKNEIGNKWKSGVLESIDGLPFIGRYNPKEPHLLVATAFSGNGMTYSAIAATIFRDIILAAPNPYITLYHAGRKVSTKAFIEKFKDYGVEFFGGFVKNLFQV